MKKILVIDDEEWLREMVRLALGQRGYEIIEAPNGMTGVEAARKHRPDLILCDVNMEKMDGYATLSSLRNDDATSAIPFILMTGLADNAGMRHGMELGADDYLPKPFTLEGLYGAVEARLKKAQTVKAQAEGALEDLRLNISMMLPHELRTPLNGILAFGEILANEPATLTLEEIADMGQTIYQSARALERLIETFLVYSQLEMVLADQQKISVLRGKQTAAPAKLIENEAGRKAAEANRKSDLTINQSPVAVPMSEEYFAKLVSELTHNAFKFSQAGTPVTVELSVTPEAVIFSVTDQGRGFEPDQIAKVGAFMQFDRKTHEQQGLGLGLTIARRLAELHGGVLAIQSERGKGTTVTVRLPKVG
jgi:two-component system, sensor histidine kinase and response regulator